MFQSLLPRRKKPEEEEDKNSLLSRAFSAKETTSTKAAFKAPVAVYRDPYAKLRRSALRIALTYILPVVGVLLIGVITFNIVSSNLKEAPNNTETVTMTNVPLPVGVRRVASTIDGPQIIYFRNLTGAWLPRSNVRVTRVESFEAIGLTSDDLYSFYKAKMIATKQWQQQKAVILVNSLELLLTRGLTNGETEGVAIEIQVGANNNLKTFTNSDNTGTTFVVAKLVASPRQ